VPVAPPAWRSKGITETAPTHDSRVRTVSVRTPAQEPVESAEPEAEDEWSIPAELEPARPTYYRSIAVGLVLAMAAGGGLLAARRFFSPAPIVTTGVVTTDPNAGMLPAGDGTSVDAEPVVPAVTTGEIEIRTEPSGVRVSVDNVPYGTSPLIVRELTPGVHTVKVENGLATMSQIVTIEAGVASSLVVALIAAPAAPPTGWVSIASPFAVELFEQGRALGSSASGRLVLPAGRHEIEMVSEPLDFREARTVQVTAGKLSVVGITPPNGSLSLNAIPWANVSIDGETVGETPIGNLTLTIGPHEVVFRNPKFGEQRRVITVTEGSPVRFSIDMTKR
jgi:PEGA domain-containing protein